MTVTINGTSGITTPGVNSTASNTLGDNVADTLNVGNGTIVTDSSGNVGIGTSSPSGKLQITNTTSLLADVTSNGSLIQFRKDATPTYASSIGNAIPGGSVTNDMLFATWNGSTWSERMRIDSSGRLLLGTTSAIVDSSALLHIVGSPCSRMQITANGQTGIGFHNQSGTQVGSITINAASTAYNTSSDYRLKENIQPMQNALAVVAQLNPVTYTWKADGSDGQGFIAHELQAVVPDCVTGEKDAVDAEGNPVYQGIDTSFLVATLTKAIQELTARVEQLEAK